MSPELEQNLKTAEGCRLVAYRDTKGFFTVGVGHKLALGKDWTGYTIDPATAHGLLVIDVNTALLEACKLPEWAALDTQCRKDAVTELVFNLGALDWRKFLKTRASISDGDWKCAHDNLLNSLWASQVGPTRSERIADQLLKGSY